MDDKKLSPNFSLFELTHTDLPAFQERNRDLTPDQVLSLEILAQLLEEVRVLLAVPIKINSGYRSMPLNTAIGSSSRSQHVLCEAADITPVALDIGVAFRILWNAVKEGQLKVGQLIFETANRPYGTTSWIHISLGEPFRPADRCAQVLRMEHGKYTTLA
jgi:zinc D-Ala-D-Ala carboxypeptidase